MKTYSHLTGYLHRWKLFSLGKFMVRVHHILDIDRTPFLHSHPFYYISIILKGGYTEQIIQKNGDIIEKTHKVGSVIIRRPHTFHRIKEIHSEKCVTLFLTYKTEGWDLKTHPDIVCEGYNAYPDGIYSTTTYYKKRLDGKWFIPNPQYRGAVDENRLSIHQNLDIVAENLMFLEKIKIK